MEKSQNRKPFQALRDLFHPVDLTHGTCWRTILQFSLPVILSYLLQQVYTISDAAIVGQTLTAQEVAGVNDTSSLVFIFLQFAFGVSAGFCAVTARSVGAHDEAAVRRSLATQIVLSAALTAVLTALALALLLNTGLLTDTLHSGQTAVQTTAAEDADRTVKSRPAEPDEAYEAEICGESTLENYVKRLYYYVDDNRSPAAREVAFWVQAMQEGDVSPAVLGQSFLFSPDRANSYTDGQAFYTMASYALLGTDVTDGNADAYLPYFAEGGAVQAYKQLFNLTSCVESFAALGVDVGTMDDRIPLDRTVLAQEVEAARATRSTQSTADEADKATYTPGYILRHPVDTVLLFVRSAVENGDHYIRTLVGGSLSYYTVDLAWGWVAVLYLLLAYAALPVQGAVMKPAGKARGWCCAAAALCCLLAVAGCLLWTPTHYDTLYGLQGRYFLPVLPLLLLTCLPRRLAAVPDEDTAQTRLVAALALVQAGMVVNIMLAIIAR